MSGIDWEPLGVFDASTDEALEKLEELMRRMQVVTEDVVPLLQSSASLRVFYAEVEYAVSRAAGFDSFGELQWAKFLETHEELAELREVDDA